jgi:hypothetical protein
VHVLMHDLAAGRLSGLAALDKNLSWHNAHKSILELTRFHGHLIVTKQGVQDAQAEESQAALSGCISPTNG